METLVRNNAGPLSQVLDQTNPLTQIVHGRKLSSGPTGGYLIGFLLQTWITGWMIERTDARSEERRVGKECRSRWSPYH